MKKKIQRSYYRHGQIRQQVPLKCGIRHGIVRHWHPNGVLASIEPFRHGSPHGLHQHWDDKGNLLGRYIITRGTGIISDWHNNGRRMSEFSMVDGLPCGRTRLWLSDGKLLRETYYIQGKPVSRHSYRRAQYLDSTLPHYRGLTRKGYRKPRVPEGHIHRLWLRRLLTTTGIQEARQWLEVGVSSPRVECFLGRFTSGRAAMGFVEGVYAAGATQVLIPETQLDKRGNKFADVILVRIPTQGVAKSAVLRACSVILKRKLGSVTHSRSRKQEWMIIGMW